MKMKRIAAVAAAVLAVSMIAPAVSASQQPKAPNDAYTNTENKTDWATGSKSTTMLKKALWINDDTDIPDAEFKFTVSSGRPQDANYENDTTTGQKVKTLAVKAGVDPDLITYKEVSVNSNSSGFDPTAAGKTLTTTKPTGDPKSSTVTLSYVGQSKITGETIGTTTDDNVVINDNVPEVGSTDTTNIDGYFAIKEVQLDFSACVFKEPGVYRYIITELKDESEISLVPGVSYADDNVRTLDVYVNHADGASNTNQLTIAGYVMYVGEQTNGPQAVADSNSKQNDNKLEDKFATNNDGFNYGVFTPDGQTSPLDYGVANGYEVAVNDTDFAQKSEGIVNSYSSHELTFKKEVNGNQGSKDKYFKFTLKINGATNGTTVSDTSVFQIDNSNCITSIGADDDTNTNTPNDATIHQIKDITTGNKAAHKIGTVTIAAVTGAQLKAGYSFYLQDGQSVTVKGLPDGVEYTLTEYQEDYTPTVALKASTEASQGIPAETWDDKNDTTKIDTLTKDGSATSDSQTASYTDSSLTADAYATFTNTRQGIVPTGVLISVAAPTFVGLGAAAGIIYLLTKKKKKDEE